MKLKWKRHRSARSLFAAHWNREGIDIFDGHWEDDNGNSPLAMLGHIRKRGMWAFVEHKAKPPMIHWWHDGKRTPAELAFLLAHEVGHVSGKRERGDLAEERRANEYARAAALAIQQFIKGAGKLPPEDGL